MFNTYNVGDNNRHLEKLQPSVNNISICFSFWLKYINVLQRILFNQFYSSLQCNACDRGKIRRYQTELKPCLTEFVDLSDNHVRVGFWQQLPLLVTHQLIGGIQGVCAYHMIRTLKGHWFRDIKKSRIWFCLVQLLI